MICLLGNDLESKLITFKIMQDYTQKIFLGSLVNPMSLLGSSSSKTAKSKKVVSVLTREKIQAKMKT